MGLITTRREATRSRLSQLQTSLKDAENKLEGKACVYATGSFGRLEAGSKSDLDVFIVGLKNGRAGVNGLEGSLLKDLDAICVKADLIRATATLGVPEFDGDGRYLAHYSVDAFTSTLGTPEDDSTNTFTARLLLLLESSPLLGEEIYNEIIADVVAQYWRDYADHSDRFIPAFLANDVLRLWRTFCVNYEARTEREPEAEKKKGKIKNYKLKHSRLLTCYSALLFLLAIYNRNDTVSPGDVIFMTKLTPTERLEWLLNQSDCSDAHKATHQLIDLYEHFLQTTEDEEGLGAKMMDKLEGRKYVDTTYEFGNTVFNVLNLIGKESRFHRLLVV